jgi:N-acetylglucosamine-6-sulfatase
MRDAATNRPGRAAAAIVAALLTGAMALAALTSEHTRAASSKPNFVMITIDDATFRDMVALPQTQALIGAQGASFRNAFASYPLCCPSRATFLTGQFAHNHGVLGNTPPDGGYAMLNDKQTIPVWMQDAGYHSVHVGKMPNGYGDGDEDYVPPGWRLPGGEFYGFVPHPPSAYYGFKLNENGTVVQYGGSDYQTDVYAEKAAASIATHATVRPDEPLFMMLQFFAPHDPALPATRHIGAFSTAPLPKDKSFNEKDFKDKPPWLRGVKRMGGGLISKVTTRYRNRLETLLAVDEAVSSVVGALQTAGMLENTYILFTSDNGFMQGQHRLHQGKFVAYDASSKVPLLLRGPGIPPGAVSKELVSNVDIVPTILDAAGAIAGVTQDGRSLLPFARQPGERTRRPILLETGRPIAIADPASAAGGGKLRSSVYVKNLDLDRTAQISGRVIKPPKYRAIRTGRYLLIKYSDGGRELYDMKLDPLQLDSVYKSGRYRAIRKFLLKSLAKLTPCVGVTCNADIGKPPKPLPPKRPNKKKPVPRP